MFFTVFFLPSHKRRWFGYQVASYMTHFFHEYPHHMYQPTTKPTTRLVQPANTPISLRIRTVWSESFLITYAFYSLRAIWRGINETFANKTYNKTCATSKYSDQSAHRRSLIRILLIACALYRLLPIGRGINKSPCHTGWMYRLIWVFAGHTCLIESLLVTHVLL